MMELTKQRENMLQTFVNTNPFDAVIVFKHSGQSFTLQFNNSHANELFGQSLELNRNIKELFNDSDWEMIQETIMTKQFNHLMMQQVNGTAVQVKLTQLEIENESYYCLVFRELNLNETIRENSFIDHAVDPVIALDVYGNVVHINQYAKALFTQEKVRSNTIFDFVATDYHEQLKILIKDALHGQPVNLRQCIVKLRANNYSVHVFPTFWYGEIVGIHMMFKLNDKAFLEHSYFQQIAYHDDLTGLLNLRALQEKWYVLAKSTENRLAILLVDLDRFKKYNESLGKIQSDELLKMFCQRLEQIRTESCEFYRYNGDEFIAVLQYKEIEEIEQLANKIHSIFEEPFIVVDQEYYLSASIGITTYDRKENATLYDLLQEADKAVFYVKRHARGNYRMYYKEMSLEFSNEVLMESHLRRAIEFNEFQVHFQPQYNLVTSQIDSFEALLRWNNRKFGAVSPNVFIPLAESSGIIMEIGNWVLEQVCKYQQKWKKSGYRPVRIAVNISPKQFKHKDFVKIVQELLERYEIPPHLIELEITESAMMESDLTENVLADLKQIGVFVSVDDFGTGYSSLSYLKSYPIDIIKIDQSFIADIQRDERNEKIIKAIILLSHTLGIEVIAEGVEEERQAEFLKDLNCEKLQGYLYDRPITGEQIELNYLKGQSYYH